MELNTGAVMLVVLTAAVLGVLVQARDDRLLFNPQHNRLHAHGKSTVQHRPTGPPTRHTTFIPRWKQLLFGKKKEHGTTLEPWRAAPVKNTTPPRSMYNPLRPRNCHEKLKVMGGRPSSTAVQMHTIYPDGHKPVEVQCGQDSRGNAYTIIQRRYYGNENFQRTWADYKRGFGSVSGDFWLGLDNIYHLTHTGNTILRFDLQSWNGQQRYATYSSFSIDPEAGYYRLYVSGYSGNVPDDFSYNNGAYFYTPDRVDQNYCAQHQKAGWWYRHCTYVHPNGVFYPGGSYKPSGQFYDGIYWKDWLGYGYSLRSVLMTLYHV